MSDLVDLLRPSQFDQFLVGAEPEYLLPEETELSEIAEVIVRARRPVSEAARPQPVAPARQTPVYHGANRRRDGGHLARFLGTSHHAHRRSAALPPDHPALTENRTLFPRSVVSAAVTPRVLVSGHNSSKIGCAVAKGPWAGFPIFTVSLEERATCPSTCLLLAECYGNAMPFARRHRHGPALIERLGKELRNMARRHPRGFTVRLHVLGDFPSADYLAAWAGWMDRFKPLHVWGYTAHQLDSAIGAAVLAGNARWPGRWAFRTSVGPESPAWPAQATTIWRADARARVAEGIVCPAQTGGTDACATCGLCWHPTGLQERIVFIGDGKRGRDSNADAAA